MSAFTAPISTGTSRVSVTTVHTVAAVSVTGGAMFFAAPAGSGADGGGGVLRSVAPMAAATWLTLALTLSVFPGVTTDMTSDSISSDWLSVWLILLYNSADVLGRALPNWVSLAPRGALVASALRACLPPLFVLQMHSDTFSSAAAPFILVTVLGVSNGYVSTLTMMHGATAAGAAPQARERAGAAMSLALLLGICTGSYAGLLLTHLFPPNDGSINSGSAK